MYIHVCVCTHIHMCTYMTYDMIIVHMYIYIYIHIHYSIVYRRGHGAAAQHANNAAAERRGGSGI